MVGVRRIGLLRRDLHGPFSTKELLEKQDRCYCLSMHASFVSVSQTTEDSQYKKEAAGATQLTECRVND